jgi:hypothetical protein
MMQEKIDGIDSIGEDLFEKNTKGYYSGCRIGHALFTDYESDAEGNAAHCG